MTTTPDISRFLAKYPPGMAEVFACNVLSRVNKNTGEPPMATESKLNGHPQPVAGMARNEPSFQDNADAVIRIGRLVTSFRRIGLAIRDKRCERSHLIVLYALMEKLNERTGTTFLSRRAISEQEGIGYESVENALYDLRRWGHIDWEMRAAPDLHRGRLLHYTMPVLTWTEEGLAAAILAQRDKLRAKESTAGGVLKSPPQEEYTADGVQEVHRGGCTPPGLYTVGGDSKYTVGGDPEPSKEPSKKESAADAPGASAGLPLEAPPSSPPPDEARAKPKRATPALPPAEVVAAFEEFWAAFPPGRKKAKAEVRDLFSAIVAGKHKKRRATVEQILTAVKSFAAKPHNPDYTPMPSTWLNGGRWEDEEPRQNGNTASDEQAAYLAAFEQARKDRGLT